MFRVRDNRRSFARLVVAAIVCTSLSAAHVRAQGLGDFLENVGELFLGRRPAPPQVQAMRAVKVDDAMLNQYTPLLRKVLVTELQFARKVCQPDNAQFAQLKAVGLAEVKQIARKFAEKQANNRSTSEWPDARESFTLALQKKMDEILPAEVAERYRQENAARWQARKEACRDMMIMIADSRLALSPEQYNQATTALDKEWDATWSRNTQVFMYADYAPRPPDSVIEPLLNPDQKLIWSGQRNYGTISFGWEGDLGFMFLRDGAFGDDNLDLLEEEEAVAEEQPAKAEARPDAPVEDSPREEQP